jgi:hypothetical protein
MNLRHYRCQAVTSAGKQCKCYATCSVNRLPYCDQHGAKEIRSSLPNLASVVGSGSEPRKCKGAGKKSEAA